MPPPVWHQDKYISANAMCANAIELIQKRKEGNPSYLAECLRDLQALALEIAAIRTQ